MYTKEMLLSEALDAWDKEWFLESIEVIEQTDFTLSIRLYIRADLFVQAFLGDLSGSLYFALIEQNQRIYGIDKTGDGWHIHPFEAPHTHIPLKDGLEPKALLKFLSRIEKLLIENDLL